MSEVETKNACTRLEPFLLPFVERCLANDRLNSQGGVLEVTRPRASFLDFDNGRNCDRFTLRIPYCGTHIHWEIIFDRNHPSQPPDIIFSSQDDELEFFPDIEKLKSFSNWSREKPNSLSTLLEELLDVYCLHHRRIVSQYHRLQFELSTLSENSQYSDVVVHCSKDNEYYEPVARYYIPLKIDFSMMPAYLTKNNPGPDTAALVVAFYPPNASRVVPTLFLSPRVEKVLGGSQSMRLPPWGSDNGNCLMDYVPMVHKLLEDKMDSIVQSYIKRKECVAAFLSVFGNSVLEYDTESYKKMSFLFEHQGFSFIASLELTDGFPYEQPSLSLRSVYHRIHGAPCECFTTDSPYSNRWNSDEYAERTRNYLIQVSPQFMELSRTQGECL